KHTILPPAESDGAGEFSSEDEGDIQISPEASSYRGAAVTALRTLPLSVPASSQLLREIDMLEIQFQIERSCRESAEALAVKVKLFENRVLKRASRALMPLIPELSEDPAALTSDTETEPAVNCETLNGSEESGDDDEQLLESQAKIAGQRKAVFLFSFAQLVLQVEEKEAIMTEMNKQSRNMSKIKRVSQLVTQEFTEMSQELELQRGLRQHAEDVAHQVSLVLNAFSPILSAFLPKVRELQDKVNEGDKDDEPGNRSVPLPPPPPPPPPATTVTKYAPPPKKTHLLSHLNTFPSKLSPDTRANAVEEMMERIKKSIILKPVCRKQVCTLSPRDKMEHQPLRREATRRGTVWNVEEAELLRVLRRRRRVMEDNWEPNALTELEPVGSLARAGESSSTPVLRRLRQNREKRNSRLRASALIISQAD
uniref:Shootin-1-like n=1 Tax=Takifugu rubripes TaxID=31033 RepID=A0A674MAI3_TAKRU